MADDLHFNDGAVSADKILKYLLNDDHEDGGPKSKFFKAHGFTEADWSQLSAALAQHPVSNVVAEQPTSTYGEKFIVKCNIATPDNRNPCICSVWIKRPGDAAPQLVTAYPED